MVWPKKSTKIQYHISIVRANKRQVNVPFGCKGYHYIKAIVNPYKLTFYS
jgi:hypothetical protein